MDTSIAMSTMRILGMSLALALASPLLAQAGISLEYHEDAGVLSVHRAPARGPACEPEDPAAVILDERGRGAADGLSNGEFSDGLTGWTVTESGGVSAAGTVSVADERAVLSEGDSFLVTLAQTFVVPEGMTRLSLTVFLDPGFDRTDAFIPDAFEVSLLDGDSLPVVPAWDPSATSSFNIQEDGTAHAGVGVSWDGETVSLDLTSVPPGREVTLYLDLIGADDDTASALAVDDVRLESPPPTGIFVRGNSNNDAFVDISDPIFTLGYLFLGTETPNCLDAADADDDGLLNITDPIFTLNYLFVGGPQIPPPFPECGADPEDPQNPDPLDCGPGSCQGT